MRKQPFRLSGSRTKTKTFNQTTNKKRLHARRKQQRIYLAPCDNRGSETEETANMTTTQEKTVKTLADTFAQSFETRTRANGDLFHCLKDDRPEWVQDAVREAHGDRMPDDWTYAQCDMAAALIREQIQCGVEPGDLLDEITVAADCY